jgi:serine/threonine protein phosphatase PrpC
MTTWKIASSYVRGQGHIKKDIPCQDRTYKLVQKHKSGIFYGLALADGAGSCQYSDIGAEHITKKILYFLKSKFSYITRYRNPIPSILKFIEKELTELANSKKIDFKELSSTLLFVVIKNDKFVIGHIGDGIIGVLNKDNSIKVVSYPENGEYSNSTFFTTSIKHKRRLRILKGTIKNAKGFILMSDGTEESLFDKKNNSLLKTNVEIINWLKNNSENKVEQALHTNLKDLISKNTHDDCSIGIMQRIKNSSL